mgnify:CR=1 FL=1
MPQLRTSVLILDLVPAMQRHADYARRGYEYAVTGSVPADKALSLARKFDALYSTAESRHGRHRAKGRGIARVVLLLYAPPGHEVLRGPDSGMQLEPDMVGFTLMSTRGDSAVHHLERPFLITDDHTRLRIGDFELLRRTRVGQARPAWTWQMRRDVYQNWRERLLRSARGDYTDTPQLLLVQLYRTPGFAGARSQVGHLVSWYRRCWRGNRGNRETFPPPPPLYYVQRPSNSGFVLGRKS